MRVIGFDASPRPQSVGAKRQVWPRRARAVRRLDRAERYSPILCIATLLIVGLLVKTAPIIQTHLAHNW
jgi:hypothetical protein